MNPSDYLATVDPPLVAILRGLTPEEAPAVGRVLIDAGFRLLEVPLNRPGALACIRLLADMAPPEVWVGGGTMLTVHDVADVRHAGGRLMVSPNCDPEVISHARATGMLCAPGVATPTEAFLALRYGAHALKLFPAEAVGIAGLKAMKSVLPAGTPLWPVGGVTAPSLGAWVDAGATGFGIGSQLFKPGMSLQDVAASAHAFVAAWRARAAA
jgi:2-dehydro-3-deoxyphosphogalactonate aldolase